MTRRKRSKKFLNPGIIYILIFILISLSCYLGYQSLNENRVLKQVIERLSADSRIAEVLVTDVRPDPSSHRPITTIKFLEYDSHGQPLEPRYFTFAGNLIQFQSLVVRFEDVYVKRADQWRGKSAYLFWKVFVLDGKNTIEYDIAPIHDIPQGYKIAGPKSAFEDKIWHEFWDYALDAKKAGKMGIRNAQVEAPGTRFIPGMLYTIKIEHDGGMRIDAKKLPDILKGEKMVK